MSKALDTVKREIEDLMQFKDRILIAIDGQCTAGKTTLAAQLAEIYDCNVFHMDDFFLRPEQRTSDRYAEIGGNIDYERFQEEVLLPLQTNQPFSYRPFDCKTFTFSEPLVVYPKQLNVVEGSYSHHPYFGNPYDLKIRLLIDSETQKQRVLQRPIFLHKRFFEQWIPMENRYFDMLKECEAIHDSIKAIF